MFRPADCCCGEQLLYSMHYAIPAFLEIEMIYD
jgi:hypothetical protein